MSTSFSVLNILQDGRFHSGEDLARGLDLSRAAIWKSIETLRGKGLDIQAVSGKGYRLAQALELLNRDAILKALTPDIRQNLTLEIHQELASTNAYLLERARTDAADALVCLCEYQTAGRGRRGRQWVSPLGANLYLSVLFRLPMSPQAIAGFSLVCGIAMVLALQDLGVSGVGLKWPNDLVWEQRKLAGILLEMSGEAYGENSLVIGIGVNVAMPVLAADRIDQPWVDLASITGHSISRNRLAAGLLNHLCQSLQRYREEGMAAFIDQWNRLDSYMGKPVVLMSGETRIEGINRGIDEHGSLLLDTGDGVQAFQSGEVSLRGI